jgi:UDP-N-acetylbacillosamine N-acetyltransferase
VKPYSGIVFLGFGGHARAVADVALSLGYTSMVFVEESAQPGETFRGYSVQPALPAELPVGWSCFPTAGDNARRMRQIEEIRKQGWPLASIISPHATIGVGAEIAEGCFVGHHAHVGPLAVISEGGIINTGAIVEHDCIIGAGTHISVQAVVAGRAHIGKQCFLGAGCTVIDKITIGDGITVGAGATVVRDLTEPGTYVGTPARNNR